MPVMFLALSYLLQTTGELCLSPVGLSEITKLTPPLLIATLTATWWLGVAWAEWIGGLIARFTGSETVAGVVLDPERSLSTYVHVFGLIGAITVGFGLLFLLVNPILKRWAHGVNDPLSHAAPEPIAPTVDGERQSVSPAMIRAEREV